MPVQREMYMCFVAFEKACDKIQHDKMMCILEECQIDSQDLQLIKSLYWGQKAAVQMNYEKYLTIAAS